MSIRSHKKAQTRNKVKVMEWKRSVALKNSLEKVPSGQNYIYKVLANKYALFHSLHVYENEIFWLFKNKDYCIFCPPPTSRAPNLTFLKGGNISSLLDKHGYFVSMFKKINTVRFFIWFFYIKSKVCRPSNKYANSRRLKFRL